MTKNKKTTMGAFRPLFLFSLFILLFALGTQGAEWNTYALDNSNTGLQDINRVGAFPIDNSHIYSDVAFGSDFQPLIGDFDGDGISSELAIFHGSLIKFYTLTSSNALQLENEFSLPSSLVSQPTSINVDSDANIEIIAVLSTSVYTLKYNGSTLNTSINSSVGTVKTGVSCVNDTTVKCYFGLNTGNITEYNANVGTHSNSIVLNNANSFDNVNEHIYISPVIYDINNDGQLELIFIDAGAGQDEGIMVVDQNDLSLDTTFSGDGLISDIGSLNGAFSGFVQGILTYDFNGGMSEVCASYTTLFGGASSSEHSYIICWDGVGNQLFNNVVATNNDVNADSGVSNPVIADTNGDGLYEVCAIGSRPTTIIAKCFDVGGNIIANSSYVDNTGDIYLKQSVTPERYSLSAGNFDTDTKTDLFIANLVIQGVSDGDLSPSGTTWFNLTTPDATNVRSNTIIADMDDDNVLEIIGQYSSLTWVASSGQENNPPELYANFGRTYANPVCNNTLIRFTGREDTDLSLPLATGTNYINDVPTDIEYLWAILLGHPDYVDGFYIEDTGDLTNPYIELWFNTTGTYYIDLCVSESLTSCTEIGTETITVQVIDGTAGSTCNTEALGVGAISSTTTTTTTTDTTPDEIVTGWNTIFNYLSGGDTSAKLLMGFVLLLMFMVGSAVSLMKMGVTSVLAGVVVGMASLLAFIILTIVGLFPVWLLVLFLLLVVLITALMFVAWMGG